MMKTLILTLALASTSVFADPVFLNIPAEHSGSPAMSIPTASYETCGDLMTKLSTEEDKNFYMSCSTVPLES